MSASKNTNQSLVPAVKPLAYHLVAHARYPHEPFRTRSDYQKMWARLKKIFPKAIAMVLMPDHLHVVVSAKEHDPIKTQKRLTSLLKQEFWQSVLAPHAIPNDVHLRRTIRYVHLNPCREGLCTDPLRWPWSTHREHLGASVTLGPMPFLRSHNDGRAEFHRYVSADPSVHPLGTPVPQIPQKPIIVDLDRIELAAEVVCRAAPGAFQKRSRLRARLMGLLAGPLKVPRVQVAAHFGVHQTSVRDEACDGANDPMLAPLLMTLSDERLLPKFR